MRASLVAFCVVSAFRGLSAQAPAWQPSPGHTQVPIWPGVPPHAKPAPGPEIVTTTGNDQLVAGKAWTYISNVSRRWSLKYGAIATFLVIGYLRLGHHTPALQLQPSLSRGGPTALGWGVFTAIVFFVVRWRGALVDLDELTDVGRGGLGLGQPRRRVHRDEADPPKDPPPS